MKKEYAEGRRDLEPRLPRGGEKWDVLVNILCMRSLSMWAHMQPKSSPIRMY